MINLSDIVRFGQLYSPGHLDDPIYTLAGGTAMQCWLRDSTGDREHQDIDVFSFKSEFLNLVLDDGFSRTGLFIGGFTQDSIVPYSKSLQNRLQIIRGTYFDAEIIPVPTDVRLVTYKNITLFLLSPEFITVSKLSYPNVHRAYDFQDVLVLNQHNCLRDSDYLSALLSKTSFGKLINAPEVLNLRTLNDLQELVDYIHRQLIRHFLYWDYVNIDALNPYQLFVLLDMGDDLFNLPSQASHFIETILDKSVLTGSDYQIAKLGLCFLTLGVSNRNLDVLEDSDFCELALQGLTLIPKYSSFWLAGTKSILVTLQELVHLETIAGQYMDSIWSPNILTEIVRRVLFRDLSRLTLLSGVRAIYQDITTGEISTSECTNLLQDVLTVSDL